MSDNLKKCIDKLLFLISIKNDKLRKKILISISDDCLFKALQEIAKNYHSTIKPKLSKKQKDLMRGRNEKIIYKLLNKSPKLQTKKAKKQILVQSGGWLPLIIPTVASILTSLIN